MGTLFEFIEEVVNLSLESNNLYSNSMLDLIDNIVEVVVNSYFYWVEDYQFREDLMQEGYLKAYELLKTGNYDPNQSLRNYLYTGVRNAMTNLNYHNNKEKHSSYDVYNDNVESSEYDVDFAISSNNPFVDYSIDMDIVEKSCNKFNSSYLGNVLDYLKEIGVCNITSDIRVQEPNLIVLKAIIVDIMWSI